MSFENILSRVGDFHRYQYFLMLFITYTTFTCGLNYYTQIFIFYTAPHRCLQSSPELERQFGHNWTLMQELAPLDGPGLETRSCFQYNDTTEQLQTLLPGRKASLDTLVGTPEQIEIPKEKCANGWAYDYSAIFSTIASEHNWVCDLDDRPSRMNQAFWIGNVFGCFVWGLMNDHLGRRPTVFVSHLLYFLGDVATFFAPTYYSIMFCRFLVGMAHHTVSHLPYLIAVEYCAVNRRTVPLFVMMSSYSLGSLTIPFLAQVLPNWQSLLLCATVPNLLVLLMYPWIPESPSWLLCKGREARAKKVLEFVARVNGKEVQLDSLELSALMQSREQLELARRVKRGSNNEDSGEGNDNSGRTIESGKFGAAKELFSYRRLMFHGVLAIVICVVGFMCYYGHVENTSNLGDNLYWSFVLGAFVEMPAYSVPVLVNVWGRRGLLLGLMLASAGTSMACGIVVDASPDLFLLLAMGGRMFATGAYYICLQFASEIFPTVMRGTGVAMCEIMGGIGLFLCPMIVYLGKRQADLPLLIFGAISTVGAFATFFLPETINRTLPQTLEDGNKFGGRRRSSVKMARINRRQNEEDEEAEFI